MPRSLTHDNTIKTTTPSMGTAINPLIKSLVVVRPKRPGCLIKHTHTHTEANGYI